MAVWCFLLFSLLTLCTCQETEYAGSEMQRLAGKMVVVERLLQEQGAEMTMLRHLLQEQTSLTHHLQVELDEKNVGLAELRQQIIQQQVTLTRQDRLLNMLLSAHTVHDKNTNNNLHVSRVAHNIPDHFAQTSTAFHDISKDKINTGSDLAENVQQLQKGQSFSEAKPNRSAELNRRADDGGPFEAVVSQLSQRVTDMEADFQSFKTQTSNDMASLQTHTDAEIETLQNRVSQQDSNLRDARSSTFTHWGHSRCSNSSQLMYSGVIGGSWYDQSGAAANFLCLTMSPVFGETKTANARLYGAEYETYDEHDDYDAVCSVCRAAYSTTVMIPGTNVCSSGWHLQYSGYLMAGANTHQAATEFICVDSAFESSAHDSEDRDGKLLYFTSAVCGSLPCHPYENTKTVLCAVCSK